MKFVKIEIGKEIYMPAERPAIEGTATTQVFPPVLLSIDASVLRKQRDFVATRGSSKASFISSLITQLRWRSSKANGLRPKRQNTIRR